MQRPHPVKHGHTTTSTRAGKKGLVTRSTTQLLLNGQLFRFAGANLHWLALDDSTTYPSQLRVNDALDAAKEMGLTVIRSHDLGISTGCANCIEPSLGVFNQTALQHVDYVIKAAADRGLHLIIPLTDDYHYPAGGKHTFTDWRGLTDENQFYTNAQVVSDFESYVTTLLNRVNSYTGIAYKHDPTIMAWETGNELHPPTSWTQSISTFIKGIDPTHLVIDGRQGIDPQAASLTKVDLVSDHLYPMSVATLQADAKVATRVGKAFVLGEFAWNDAYGGDSLSAFLAAAQANPAVAGEAFWELWSHDDQYGYVHHEVHYDLHYPGDTAAMRSSVQLLRSAAYKMSNQAVPSYSVPGAPLLETVIRNGSSNTLVWRGTSVGASYSVKRSSSGPTGPWTLICNKCATDNSTPWVDPQVPGGPLWYSVTAYNLAGLASVPSASFQAGSTGLLIDNLNDWSHTYQHSSNLGFDSSNAQYMRGDASRVIRTAVTAEFVSWKLPQMKAFQAIAYSWLGEPVVPLSFCTSADGTTWTSVVPSVVILHGDWPQYIYSLQGLSGVSYVKIVWSATGQSWNPNLGAVNMLS